MAVGIASGQANSILDALARGTDYPGNAAVWVKLHTGDPGSAGTSNAAGNTLNGAVSVINQGNWWWAFFPGMAIIIIVLGINFMGDGLQDALDPRAKI